MHDVAPSAVSIADVIEAISCTIKFPLPVISSIPPPCHLERSRELFAAIAACAFGRIHEMSPRANAWST